MGPEYLQEPDEAVFRTDLRHVRWWRVLAAGAVVGLCAWLVMDRDVSWHRLLTWAAVGAAGFSVYWLPQFHRTLLEEIRVGHDRLTVVRKGGTREYAWSDLEVAYFERYPVVNLRAWVHCFRFRASGKNREVCLDGLDERARQALCAAISNCLRMHGVPERSPAMWRFEHQLSHWGAWVFVLGGFGLLAAHFFGYHTLGTVFGLASMLTGTCIALMTRKERASRLVLVGSAVLAVGAAAIAWALDINVREVLEQWERRERRLGRPPWKASNPKACVDEEADSGEATPVVNRRKVFQPNAGGIRVADRKPQALIRCNPRPSS